jgi:hypothetical protein
MGAALLILAGLIAIVPAAAAMSGDVGVAPQQGFLFGTAALTVAAVAIGVSYQNRFAIWRTPSARLTRRLAFVAVGAGVGFVAYLLLYSLCVVESATYEAKLLFPIQPTGKLAEMIARAGSRFQAMETYGLAAVFDAISEAPLGYGTALAALVTLYAVPIGVTCAVAFVLALRYPSALFRPQLPAGSGFDVFLCYNRADALAVRAISHALAGRGVRYFLDESENPPGRAWTDAVGAALASSKVFAVFLGAAGVGRWQAIEIQNIAEARVNRDCAVIPVWLPDSPASVEVPMQLAGLTWVDFRQRDPDPMTELLRGIRVQPGPSL